MKTKITLFFVISLFVYSVSYSYHRFAAYSGSNCSDCHINPAGGSMRNMFGVKWAKENLSLEALSKVSLKSEFNGQITQDISIGADTRLAAVNNTSTNNQPNVNTFLQMQGDLYVYAKVNKYVSVFVSPGISIPESKMKYDVYGMISNLPAKIFFKAGRFTPNFGLRIPEHRAFHRSSLLNTPYSADAGFELGLHPGIFNFSMGLFNGLKTDFYDSDQNKMFVSSGDFTLVTNNENFSFNFGLSVYNNPFRFTDPVTFTQVDANNFAYGGFTRIGIMQRVALVGEYDLEESNALSVMTRREYRYAELGIMVIKGVELRGTYEFRNRNRDLSDNSEKRYSIGTAFFLLNGFETELMYRFNDSKDNKKNEFQWNFHFYF